MPEKNYAKYRERILATARRRRANRSPEKKAADQKRDRERNARRPVDQRRRRDYFLRHRYGITQADFNQILASQNGRCACCDGVSANWHVDHDHTTGKVRGILCHRCNVQLGQLGDSIDGVLAICARFLQYLKRIA